MRPGGGCCWPWCHRCHCECRYHPGIELAPDFVYPVPPVAGVGSSPPLSLFAEERTPPPFEDPPFEADDERVVYAAARQLGQDGHLDTATYAAAQQLLGDAGMVELVSLCGYYSLISFLLNAFDVGLPPGASPVWPPKP